MSFPPSSSQLEFIDMLLIFTKSDLSMLFGAIHMTSLAMNSTQSRVTFSSRHNMPPDFYAAPWVTCLCFCFDKQTQMTSGKYLTEHRRKIFFGAQNLPTTWTLRCSGSILSVEVPNSPSTWHQAHTGNFQENRAVNWAKQSRHTPKSEATTSNNCKDETKSENDDGGGRRNHQRECCSCLCVHTVALIFVNGNNAKSREQL